MEHICPDFERIINNIFNEQNTNDMYMNNQIIIS